MFVSYFSIFNYWVINFFYINKYHYSQKSFNDIDAWLKELKSNSNPDVKLFLVGNKVDLENDREVTYADAKQLADSWGIEYMETSAKNNFNCKEAFEKLAQQIVKSKSSRPKSGSCCIIIWKKLLPKNILL